jgi:hypothetical protein
MKVQRSAITQSVEEAPSLEAGPLLAGAPVADSESVGDTVGNRVGHAVMLCEVGSVTVGLHRHDAESRWYICTYIIYMYT